jgi:DNA-binding transcriptional LysR family regulator
MLDLRRLRLLRELDARGTVHAAARALDYTPSAVSQQLAVLEREAGATLLERTGRTLRLTDAGRLLVEHAGALLDRMEAAEADVAALVAGRPAGTVQIAAFQTAFLQLVAPAIARLAADHPDVRVEAAEIEVEEAVGLLRLGHLDVVVGDEYEGVPRPVWPDLDRVPLLTEQVRVMLPEDHALAGRSRVALDRLAGAVWVGSRSSTGHRAMQLRVCRERGGFEPDIRYRSDDLAIQLEMVRTTGAAGLLPDLVLQRGIRGIAAPLVAGGGIGREVFTLTRRARTPAVQVVLDALSASRTDRSARRRGRRANGASGG